MKRSPPKTSSGGFLEIKSPASTSREEEEHPTDPHAPSPIPSIGEEGEPNLPQVINITDNHSLAAEFDRLSALLTTTTANWQARTHSLHRISEIAKNPEWNSFSNWLPLLDQHRLALAAQLTDRRSAVVKQACATIITISAALKSKLLHVDTFVPSAPATTSSVTTADVQSARYTWLSLVCYWFEHLLPNIPVTIKVISEATIQAVQQILSDIAPSCIEEIQIVKQHTGENPAIPDEDDNSHHSIQKKEYALLYSVLAACSHKHAAVRDQAYRGLSSLVTQIPASYIAMEHEADFNEATQIKQTLVEYKSASANYEPTSPLPFTPNPHPHGSFLFHSIEIALHRGAADPDAKTRASSRLALIQFLERCSVDRGERVVMSMPLASQKIFEKDKQDVLVGKLMDNVKGENQSKKPLMSIKERLKRTAASPSKKSAVPSSSSPRSSRVAHGASPGSSSPSRGSMDFSFTMGPFLSAPPDTLEEKLSDNIPPIQQNGTSTEASAANSLSEGVLTSVDKEASNAFDASSGVISAPTSSDSTSPKSLGSTNDSLQRNPSLLFKLVDLDSPTLTDKMTDFLMLPGVLESLMDFVTRIPASPESTPSPSSPSPPYICRLPPSTPDELIATKRSYNVMNMLTPVRPSVALQQVFNKKMDIILRRLLSVFHPASKGNIYHTAAILTKLLSICPSAILALLSSPSSDPVYFQSFLLLFEHLHEPPVAALILSFFIGGEAVGVTAAKKAEEKKSRIALVTQVRKADVLITLTKRICIMPNDNNMTEEACQTRALAAVDFLSQVVEKVSEEEYLSSFLATICEPQSLIQQLVNVITAVHSNNAFLHSGWQRIACSNLLSSLLAATENSQLTVNDLNAPRSSTSEMSLFASKKIPNPLFGLKAKVSQQIKDRLNDLYNALIVDEGGKAHAFTSSRMAILSLITKHCELNPDSCLLISHSIWSILVDWFFHYEHNNFYLSAFLHLYLVILRGAPDSPLHTTLLRYLLVDLKFISRLVTAYHHHEHAAHINNNNNDKTSNNNGSDNPNGARPASNSNSSTALDATILVLASHLRLTASLLSSSSFLFSHLASHTLWRSFQPILQHETMIQAQTIELPQSEDNIMLRVLQGLPAIQPETRRPAGIDIGSAFAYSLGYEQEASNIVGASTKTAATARKNKKKKKKEQKKKKKLLETEASGDTADTETSESGANEETDGGDDEPDGESIDESHSNNSMHNMNKKAHHDSEEKHEVDDIASLPAVAVAVKR